MLKRRTIHIDDYNVTLAALGAALNHADQLSENEDAGRISKVRNDIIAHTYVKQGTYDPDAGKVWMVAATLAEDAYDIFSEASVGWFDEGKWIARVLIEGIEDQSSRLIREHDEYVAAMRARQRAEAKERHDAIRADYEKYLKLKGGKGSVREFAEVFDYGYATACAATKSRRCGE